MFRPGAPVHDDGETSELSDRILIADTHIDLPYRLKKSREDVSVRTEGGDFDYPRARAGGLDLAFLAIYVPASHQRTGDAARVADELIDMVEALARVHADKFATVTSVAQARERFDQGRIGLALGLENGAALEGRLDNVRHFHDRGIRYITLVHSKSNRICDSSFDDGRPWGGLSPFGREVVAEMNRLGVIVDVSHITDDAFFQVMDLSAAPVIASHSSCRHFTPGWERNMSDEMIRRLAGGGGVIQINFGSSFISDDYRREFESHREAIRAHLRANGIAEDSDEAAACSEAYFRRHPIPHAKLSEVVDHIDHVVRLAGIDHVGFGSDFEGVGDSLPVGLEDVSAYPNLIRALHDRGYSDGEVEKIASANLFRVWSAVERVAGEQQGANA